MCASSALAGGYGGGHGHRKGTRRGGRSRNTKGMDDEVRIVLLGKTGSGKSATGNTILNGDFFMSSTSGSSVTSKCTSKHAQRLGKDIQVVDTPGIFDTNLPNDVVQREIVKCIGITSPGPHCFLLVLGLSRFTQEEEESIDHFVNYFGSKVFRYFIILFTRKDDLDHHGLTLDDHIRTVPQSLKTIIQKCDHRCIAFDNRAPSPTRDDQVAELLEMIDDIICQNQGECYCNDMYIEAEKVMKHRQYQIEQERERGKQREKRNIEREIEQKYKNLQGDHARNQNALENRVALLESKRDFQVSRSSTLLREIADTQDQIDHERKKYGKASSKLQSKLKDLEDEKASMKSGTDTSVEEEITDLRQELKRMRKHAKKMTEEKDRTFQEKLKEHDMKFKELDSARQETRKEVETGSGNVGEVLMSGMLGIGKLAWKGIQYFFM